MRAQERYCSFLCYVRRHLILLCLSSHHTYQAQMLDEEIQKILREMQADDKGGHAALGFVMAVLGTCVASFANTFSLVSPIPFPKTHTFSTSPLLLQRFSALSRRKAGTLFCPCSSAGSSTSGISTGNADPPISACQRSAAAVASSAE